MPYEGIAASWSRRGARRDLVWQGRAVVTPPAVLNIPGGMHHQASNITALALSMLERTFEGQLMGF